LRAHNFRLLYFFQRAATQIRSLAAQVDITLFDEGFTKWKDGIYIGMLHARPLPELHRIYRDHIKTMLAPGGVARKEAWTKLLIAYTSDSELALRIEVIDVKAYLMRCAVHE
jgi:hypothetical protein